MKNTRLFAIDPQTEETILSESEKGSNKVISVARIHRSQNTLLYDAVNLLTAITKDPNFDSNVFKAMDKVCELMVQKHLK